MLPIIILVGAVVLIVWYERSKAQQAAPVTTSPALPGATSSQDGGMQATFPITTAPGGGAPAPGGTLPPAATASAPMWRRVGRHGLGHGTQWVTIAPGQRFRLVMTVPVVRTAVSTWKVPYNKGGIFLMVQNYLAVKGAQITVWAENEQLPADWPKPIAVDPVNGDPFGPYAYRVEGVATAPATFGDFVVLGTSGWQAWALST